MKSIRYSILDLATIAKGDTITKTFEKSVQSAQRAEELGYHRYWFSEHHNMPNVASASTSLLIGHVAEKTNKIRVGSGGVMLPNHSTLSVAEQFGTLDALHPHRIDLGLGRAPGTDGQTAMILRRGNFDPHYDFEAHVNELNEYFKNTNPDKKVRAIPGEGADVPMYILGSSTDSAYVAAKLGLPYAFAAHFAPAQLKAAVGIYKHNFQASEHLEQAYMMVCVNVIAADERKKAEFLSRSMKQMFINILTNQRKPLEAPEHIEIPEFDAHFKAHFDRMTAMTFIGDQYDIKEGLASMQADLNVDEIIVSTKIFDFEAHKKSLEITAQVLKEI